jgi:hypothetical protein
VIAEFLKSLALAASAKLAEGFVDVLNCSKRLPAELVDEVFSVLPQEARSIEPKNTVAERLFGIFTNPPHVKGTTHRPSMTIKSRQLEVALDNMSSVESVKKNGNK